MFNWWKAQFRAAGLSQSEKTQRSRTLTTLLWMQVAMAIPIGLVNLRLGSIPEAIMLFVVAAVCFPALWLNRRGQAGWAAVISVTSVLAVLDLTLYEAGGIHDAAVVTIPIFVMLGTLLFSRNALPLFSAAALISVIAIGSLELSHGTPGQIAKTMGDIIVISLLTIGSGLLVWVIVGNLEENLRRARQSEAAVRDAYDRTLEGWSKTLEYRDPGTHGHAQRVVKLCMRLAQEWGFDREQMAHIQRGAILHDIGKMVIPDRILLKRGPLNAREWKIMRQHPVVARELLAEIPYLRPAVNIPASHHEHWDGSGYPRGWRGRRIPIEARIFTVVDQYDALSSDRPYRKAWPPRKALDYIQSNAGKIFDPEVCETFLRLYRADAFGADT